MRHPFTQHEPHRIDGSKRSVMLPHLYVVGSYQHMLEADFQAALGLKGRAEQNLEESLREWQHATGKTRAVCRAYLARDIDAYRRAAKVCAATRRRWWLDAMLRICEREVMRDGVLASGVRYDH